MKNKQRALRRHHLDRLKKKRKHHGLTIQERKSIGDQVE